MLAGKNGDVCRVALQKFARRRGFVDGTECVGGGVRENKKFI